MPSISVPAIAPSLLPQLRLILLTTIFVQSTFRHSTGQAYLQFCRHFEHCSVLCCDWLCYECIIMLVSCITYLILLLLYTFLWCGKEYLLLLLIIIIMSLLQTGWWNLSLYVARCQDRREVPCQQSAVAFQHWPIRTITNDITWILISPAFSCLLADNWSIMTCKARKRSREGGEIPGNFPPALASCLLPQDMQ